MGRKIKIARVIAGYTQKELAKATGISVDYISMLERGKINNPSLKQMKKISKALGVPASELFFNDEL
ncbi:helix-turn-helix transcriptional regulator [Intestinibacter sp.]